MRERKDESWSFAEQIQDCQLQQEGWHSCKSQMENIQDDGYRKFWKKLNIRDAFYTMVPQLLVIQPNECQILINKIGHHSPGKVQIMCGGRPDILSPTQPPEVQKSSPLHVLRLKHDKGLCALLSSLQEFTVLL